MYSATHIKVTKQSTVLSINALIQYSVMHVNIKYPKIHYLCTKYRKLAVNVNITLQKYQNILKRTRIST